MSESEYSRALHETGNCEWHCPYCADEAESTERTMLLDTLRQISELDHMRAATNCCALTAVTLARTALNSVQTGQT